MGESARGPTSAPSLICIPLIGGEENQEKKRGGRTIFSFQTQGWGRWEGIQFRIPSRHTENPHCGPK